ncbi:MAG: hypothetical protein V1753_09530 [Pseudomonadota bacterium]
MKNLIACFIVMLLSGGCALGPASVRDPERISPKSISSQIAKESDQVGLEQQERINSLEGSAQPDIQVRPVMPKYDPLEDQVISFSMLNEDLQLVLYAFSEATGMDIVIDPALATEKKLVTFNFVKAPASTILKEILRNVDLYYEVEDNIIRIKLCEERVFYLNFIDMKVKSSFDVGGDVLGASGDSAPLTGSYKLTGESAETTPYDFAENMIKPVISETGKYSLNRASGALYVKDKPSVILAVARLIDHLRDMLSRQILIEARIIEIELLDDYKYGVDWKMVQNRTDSSSRLSETEWKGEGLILRGFHRTMNLDATLSALRTFGDTKIVSNPVMRCKHGQPGMISVGTSYSYIASTSREVEESEGVRTVSYSYEAGNVFDGLTLGVTPFIEGDGSISLLINPIKSDVDQASLELINPVPEAAVTLPKVGVKEMSANIALHTGDVIMLGGLIDKLKQTEKRGVPFLSAIPLVGYLFKFEVEKERVRELVIVLSVNIV